MINAEVWNAEYIDEKYEQWRKDPKSVEPDWDFFFKGFELGKDSDYQGDGTCTEDQVRMQAQVEALIYTYRDIGHLLACLDPLVSCPTDHPLLNIHAFGLDEDDLDMEFWARSLTPSGRATLKEILSILKTTYCKSIGVEYMHIQDPQERKWLQGRMETSRNQPSLSEEEKEVIYHKLCHAALFENHLHKKYLGQKRFSLEGADVIIPMLHDMIRYNGENGVDEVVMGMAHRGRLNVLTNIMMKLYTDVFREFNKSDHLQGAVGAGDVKYHKGYSSIIPMPSGKEVRATLANNPSHLEAVNPLVSGMTRAKQDKIEGNKASVLPVLLHGDAAFAGQGITHETLNMMHLEGYLTHGTIHIIINNQIGYTTLPEDARSTRYSTDVAKNLMIPIFHVHGENPEAVLHVARLASDYRKEFGKDVVIDVVCYRRYGHNEGDEPYFTQPLMYDRIKERPPLYKLYQEELTQKKVVSEDKAKTIVQDVVSCLEESFTDAKENPASPSDKKPEEKSSGKLPDKTVSKETLTSLAKGMYELPETLHVHPKLVKLMENRLSAVTEGKGIDWANAELLAFASLLHQGVNVRLSGQDCQRGTFAQRHSVITDMKTDEKHNIVTASVENGRQFFVYNSHLSEAGVLGFEYGYSLGSPEDLVLWEAQFGDFANNAQAIMDQFISSGESKWQVKSRLTLLLPHGFEGQGAEHSSARLERYLQLCAENNMRVCYPSTPAQHYHMLRRQITDSEVKPLVVMTPKSLLRHPQVVSDLTDLSDGVFQKVIPDDSIKQPDKMILCSGKIFYELFNKREETKNNTIGITRVEQLYPFPKEELEKLITTNKQVKKWVWVQEEPKNMGAYRFIQPEFKEIFNIDLDYIGRVPAASPSTGYAAIYKQEQTEIIKGAIEI